MSRGARGIVAFLALLIALAVGSVAVEAQSAHPWEDSSLLGWSALERAGHLPRAVPLRPPSLPSLLGPEPRVGTFWSTRNPAGLAWEVDAAHAELGGGASAVSGDYRRPLEPGAVDATSLGGLAWEPVGDRSAMAGHVTYVETGYDPGTPATTLSPHGSNPFVLTDSTASAHRIQSIRLDGAGGRRFGRLGLGVALGFEAVSGFASLTAIPRRSQASRPGAVVGGAWELGEGAARVGSYVRWTAERETSTVAGVGTGVEVTLLRGFAEPDHAGLDPGRSYLRRREADELAAGVTASGVRGDWSWAVHGESGGVEEGQRSVRQHDPPTDTWDADLVAAGGALRGPLGGAAVLTFSLDWTRSEGEARLHDAESSFYRSTEEVATGSADVRWSPEGSTWTVRGLLAFGYDRRQRGEQDPELVHTDLEGLSTRLGVEVGHRAGERLRVAAGASRTGYQPRGSAPRPGNFHVETRPLLGPETAYYATPARAIGARAGARFRATERLDLRLDGGYERIEPQPAGATAEMQPTGERSAWSLALLVVLR